MSRDGALFSVMSLPRRYLYDSPLESQLTQVFDANKRLLYTGDAVPEEVSLVKGDHTARVMLRHDNIALLEKLKNTCLVRCASSHVLSCSASELQSLKPE
jgi:hypothetical protein